MTLKDIDNLGKQFKEKELPTSRDIKISMGTYDRYINLTKSVSTWRTIALIFALSTAISTVGFVVSKSSYPYVPYVVRVEPNGAVSGSKLTATSITSDMVGENEINYFISNVISKFRVVGRDRKVYLDNVKSVYPFLTSNSKGKIEHFINTSTNTTAVIDNGYTISSKVKVFIKMGVDKYQLDWVETTFDVDGNATYEVEYRALVDIAYIPIKSDDEIRTNPLGLIIKDIEIKQVSSKSLK